MENQIVSYQTLESPRKTGGLIAGVTLLVVGAAVAIYYLVNESRKADEEYLKKIKEAEASQAQGGTTDSYDELLDDPEYLSIGCSGSYNRQEDVDVENPDANDKKCGNEVFEFQAMLAEFGYLPEDEIDGKYGPKTRAAHQQYLDA